MHFPPSLRAVVATGGTCAFAASPPLEPSETQRHLLIAQLFDTHARLGRLRWLAWLVAPDKHRVMLNLLSQPLRAACFVTAQQSFELS